MRGLPSSVFAKKHLRENYKIFFGRAFLQAFRADLRKPWCALPPALLQLFSIFDSGHTVRYAPSFHRLHYSLMRCLHYSAGMTNTSVCHSMNCFCRFY